MVSAFRQALLIFTLILPATQVFAFAEAEFPAVDQDEYQFVAESCGQSEQAARYRARRIAEERAAHLQAQCEATGGVFSVRYSNGYCTPYEPSDPSCPIICSVIGRATCASGY